MMDPWVEIVSRMRGIKEDLQEQMEIGLANALVRVREKESHVNDTEALRSSLKRGDTVKLSAAALQYRAAYQNMLAQQLEQQLADLDQAKSVAAQHKDQVKQAYIETHQWLQLEETQHQKLKQERDQKNQAEADDLAGQRYFSQSRGSQ